MNPRHCILHIGTHKTASTALQLFLHENSGVLRAAGIHLSEVGRPLGMAGNHEIAWALAKSGESELLEPLLKDIAGSGCRTAIITSEEFSLLHSRPAALKSLAEGIASIGFRPIVLGYFRAQAEFAESVYVERVKSGRVGPLDEYVSTILETGRYRWEASITDLRFDYAELLSPFVQAFGPANIVARAYNRHLGSEHVFTDFLTVLTQIDQMVARSPLRLTLRSKRANESMAYVDLLYAAYRALYRENALPAQQAAPLLVSLVRRLTPEITDDLLLSRFALLTRSEALAFLERFTSTNLVFERIFSARVPFFTEADIESESHPHWANARIHRTTFDLLLERWMQDRPPPL